MKQASGLRSKSQTPKQTFQSYFLERPLALSVTHLLSQNKQGMTATELAEQLHLSVPTLYRLTLEMHQLRLLVNERHGRKNIFKISASIQDILPSIHDSVKKILDNRPSKIDQLMMTKTVLEDYNLSLSPRVAESMVVSVLKQKINEHLPQGVRHRNVSPLNTVLNDIVKFDLYIGNDSKYVAIELKIIETVRGMRERIGTLAMLDTQERAGLTGIILAYIISNIGGKWFIDEQTISKAITSLNLRNVKLLTVVSKADRVQILDTNFIDQFALSIIQKIKEVLSIE